jgi:hypothetical protein
MYIKNISAWTKEEYKLWRTDMNIRRWRFICSLFKNTVTNYKSYAL